MAWYNRPEGFVSKSFDRFAPSIAEANAIRATVTYVKPLADVCIECNGTDWLQDQEDGTFLCMPCCAGEKGVDW